MIHQSIMDVFQSNKNPIKMLFTYFSLTAIKTEQNITGSKVSTTDY